MHGSHFRRNGLLTKRKPGKQKPRYFVNLWVTYLARRAKAYVTADAMTWSKPIFTAATIEGLIEGDREERQLALEYLAEAWNAAEDDGVESQALAHASLFAALATLVRAHGEEATATLISALPDRIRAGEYNLDRQLQ